MLCWCVNHGWHAASAGETSAGLSIAYWLLPKPADLSWLLFDLLRADHYFGRLLDYSALRDGGVHLAASILTSLVFTVLVLVLSARRFARTDY